eukprot:747928-Hanusia_phi.AAC.1
MSRAKRKLVMRNVAYNKPVTTSSHGAGNAQHAVDGIVNVFFSVPFENSHATTSGKVGEVEWLEVDLGRNELVRAVDVWGAARARARLQYPMVRNLHGIPDLHGSQPSPAAFCRSLTREFQVVDDGSLAPFEVHLLKEDREANSILHFNDHSSVYSKTGILGVARYVRISRKLRNISSPLAVLELEVSVDGRLSNSSSPVQTFRSGPNKSGTAKSIVSVGDACGRKALKERPRKCLPASATLIGPESCATRYVPLKVMGDSRENNFWDQRLFDEAMNDLRANQFPEKCEAGKMVNIRFENRGRRRRRMLRLRTRTGMEMGTRKMTRRRRIEGGGEGREG